MTGDITKDSPLSDYQPSAEVCALTNSVRKDYEIGTDILNRGWPELNGRSVLEDENRGQLMFNAHVDTSVEDPSQAWKWRGTRSMARNKGIAMHANLTANYLLPLFVAQNENDEVDKDFSEVMRDIIEWMAMPSNSNYQSSFLQVVFGMMSNPVTYLGAEYCEVFQKIKQRQDNGDVTIKEILDQVLSGFQAPVYSSSQILLTNAYERNIQKQRRIIKRHYPEKEELEAKYGQHPNWIYVKGGFRSVYNEENGLFYDVYDDTQLSQTIVEEEIALSRRDDSEVPFVNGIYLGDENVEHNPIHHRDNRGAPKYDVVPFGYHRIGQHFFYYKSMMNILGWDNMLYDAMSEVVMNRAFLETEMPIVVSGSDEIDSQMVFPNAVIAFEDKDTKAAPLLPNSNMVAGFNALNATAESISEGSVSDTVSGQLPDASQKAYTVAQAQASSKKLIAAVGKSLAESVIQYGDLMKDIAVNHITVAQIEELEGGNLKLKYKSFMLPNKVSGGRVMDKYIKFDDSLIGAEMTKSEKDMENLKMLEEYPSDKGALIRVNPELFAKFNYLSKVDIEEMFTKNQDFWQPILLNLKQALINDPYTDQEALTRRLFYSYFQSEGDNYVKKPQPALPGAVPGMQQQQQGGNQFGNQVNSQLLSTAASGATAQ